MDRGSVLVCAAGWAGAAGHILHGAAAAAQGAEPCGPAVLAIVDLKTSWIPFAGIWDAEGAVVAVRI